MKTHLIIICAVARRTNNGITMSCYLCILLLRMVANQACAWVGISQLIEQKSQQVQKGLLAVPHLPTEWEELSA